MTSAFFFIRKTGRIRSDIDAVDFDPSVRNALPPDQGLHAAHTFHSLQPFSENDVSLHVHKSAEKFCPLDTMAASLVVGCLDVLLPVFSRIINFSLSCRHFSKDRKEALVTPPCQRLALYVKTDTACCFRPNSQSHESIRPLSNLTIRLPSSDMKA